MDIEVIVAGGEKADGWSDALWNLTRSIESVGVELAHGCLGGEYGYGANYENDEFKMHPFCWCEQGDCPWCCGCECEESAFHYFVDGIEVDYPQYEDFFDRETFQKLSGGLIKDFLEHLDREDAAGCSPYTHDEWMAAAAVANARRTTRHDPECKFCRGEFPSPESGAMANGMGAPHFWHKPTGVRIWWYKYIGRDMKLHGDGIPQEVIASCIRSLKPLGI